MRLRSPLPARGRGALGQLPDRMPSIEISLLALVVVEVTLHAPGARTLVRAVALATHRHRRKEHVCGLGAGARLVALEALDRTMNPVIEDGVPQPPDRDARRQILRQRALRLVVLHVTELALLLEQDVLDPGDLAGGPGQWRRPRGPCLGLRSFLGRAATEQPASSRLLGGRLLVLGLGRAPTQQTTASSFVAVGLAPGRRATGRRLGLGRQSEITALGAEFV